MALMRAAFSLHGGKQAHRFHRQFGAAQDDVGHLAHLQLEFRHLEQGDGLGRLLHLVDGVIELVDQLLDVAAVEAA